MLLSIEKLTKKYDNKIILNELSFGLEDGEFLSVLGANGAGKTTLFKCILNTIADYSGHIILNGVDVRNMSAMQISSKIAYIPQNSSSVFNYSVKDIVLMGTSAGKPFYKVPGSADEKRVEDAMEKIGIASYADRCFHQLSGGEKQLVIIARALAQNAKILLFDEPTSALDYGNQMLVLNEMKKLSEEGYAVMQTTHNPEHAYMFSDKIVAIKNGRVIKQGTPSEIIEKQTLSDLYESKLSVESLLEDKVRVCIPELL